MAAYLYLALVLAVFARWSKDLFVIFISFKAVCTIVDCEHIDNGESQRRGAAGSRRWSRDDLQAHGGGAVWRRGGADSRSGKLGALIPPEDGFVEDGDGSKVCWTGSATNLSWGS
jgi:hypothetical protein